MKKNLIVTAAIFISSFSSAQEKKETGFDFSKMKTYYLVFLVKGDNRTQDSTTAAKIQEQHLAHLSKMATGGKMSLAGPLMEDGNIRGICVYNTDSKEEAIRLANADPAVISGRLKVEIHSWYSEKGACLR